MKKRKKGKKHHDPVIHSEHKRHNVAHGLPPDVFAQPQDAQAMPTAPPMAPTQPMPMPGAAPQPPPM